MFTVNLRVISELRAFLHISTTEATVLNHFRRDPTDFTRRRKLCFGTLVLFIARLCKKTLSVELDKFFEEDIRSAQRPPSVSAYSQQRAKLDSFFFQVWNEVLCQSFYHYGGKAYTRRWRGSRLIAVDGSGISLVSTPALAKHFGGQRNQQGSFTGAKAFFHYDVLNRLFTYSRIAPYRTPELAMAWETIEQLPGDSIAIYDRNFCNYKTIALHVWQEQPRRFVIRAKESHRLIAAFIQSGLASQVVQMYPPDKCAIQGMYASGYRITPATSLTIRLVRVALGTGGTEVLITNLWEEDGYGPEIFGELYFMRWGVETAIGLKKNLLQLESFSGLTVESVCQDFYATVFVANLCALLTRQAEEELAQIRGVQKEQPNQCKVQINRNKACGRLRNTIAALFLDKKPEQIIEALCNYFRRHTLPVIKGRHFERKRKNKQSNSKHKTYCNYKPAI